MLVDQVDWKQRFQSVLLAALRTAPAALPQRAGLIIMFLLQSLLCLQRLQCVAPKGRPLEPNVSSESSVKRNCAEL